MPTLSREGAAHGPLVQSFVGRGFRVDGIVHGEGLLLTPERAIGWPAPPLDQLTVAALDVLLTMAPPEFILLGTGSTLRRAPPAFIAELEGRGIGVEAMDSRAAARAWGVLRSEDRWIAAALLPL